MSDFHEHLIQPGEDPTNDVLYALSGGMPFLFLTITEFTEDDGFNIAMQAGGGVQDLQTIWSFLSKATTAVESQMLDQGQIPTYLTEEELNELDDKDDEG